MLPSTSSSTHTNASRFAKYSFVKSSHDARADLPAVLAYLQEPSAQQHAQDSLQEEHHSCLLCFGE
jgi:hypothetical protein